MEKNKVIEFLSKSPLFQSLTESQLKRISLRVKLRQFFPNDIIVWQGQPSNSLFVISNGIVAVKSITNETENLLAYLMPGNSFGEVGILENQPRSASVVALSDVDVLVIQRDDFLYILNRYSSVAIELARTLGRYLVESNRRISQDEKTIQLILIFNVHSDTGGSGLASLMAAELTHKNGRPTVYVEYRNNREVLESLQSPSAATGIYHHPNGFDIILPQEDSFIPSTTRTTLLLDKLKNKYENIIVSLPESLDDSNKMLLEHADQILLLASPKKDAHKRLDRIKNQIGKLIRPGETSIFTMINRSKPEYKDESVTPPPTDFELPYLEEFPSYAFPERKKFAVPKVIANVIDTCIDRLERNHTIAIFIPTTTDVDQPIDTSAYVKEVMNFMAERFGGVTSREANGVWNSEHVGLVGETVYIIESYMSRLDMNLHLDEVVNLVKRLKLELSQEAMALEVDRKLTLI
jgi:CRP-like cAMP-binding protein